MEAPSTYEDDHVVREAPEDQAMREGSEETSSCSGSVIEYSKRNHRLLGELPFDDDKDAVESKTNDKWCNSRSRAPWMNCASSSDTDKESTSRRCEYQYPQIVDTSKLRLER